MIDYGAKKGQLGVTLGTLMQLPQPTSTFLSWPRSRILPNEEALGWDVEHARAQWLNQWRLYCSTAKLYSPFSNITVLDFSRLPVFSLDEPGAVTLRQPSWFLAFQLTGSVFPHCPETQRAQGLLATLHSKYGIWSCLQFAAFFVCSAFRPVSDVGTVRKLSKRPE
jgi:hypothetical protein